MILVTGGCGFIGGHIVDRLIDKDKEVIVVDNEVTGNYHNPKAIYFNKPDITSDNLISLLKDYKIETIYHLAAQINLRKSFEVPAFDAENNIIGTINVINLAKEKSAKLIFASTGGAMYSSYEATPWKENSEALPNSPYALSKYCAEHYIRLIAPSNSMILRLANVYGPRQNPHGEAGVIAIFLNNIFEGKACKIFGDGGQVRDYIYIDDVVNAFIAASEFRGGGGTYNISTKIGTDLTSLVMMLIKEVNREVTIKKEAAIPGELYTSILDYQKFKLDTEWVPAVSLEDGIRKTIEWYDNTGK